MNKLAAGLLSIVLLSGFAVSGLAMEGGSHAMADQATHLFEPFYRTAGSKSGGAGLGLALVRQIAERHGGTARYSPTGDSHNSFSVELPA
jgi:C4-dicarboxylate-specific signal transduction histidine kinase